VNVVVRNAGGAASAGEVLQIDGGLFGHDSIPIGPLGAGESTTISDSITCSDPLGFHFLVLVSFEGPYSGTGLSATVAGDC
jgi:hypothetical protein